MKRSRQAVFGAGALLGLGIAAASIIRKRDFGLVGKTVFISGGSRGLGLLLAHEFAARGERCDLCPGREGFATRRRGFTRNRSTSAGARNGYQHA